MVSVVMRAERFRASKHANTKRALSMIALWVIQQRTKSIERQRERSFLSLASASKIVDKTNKEKKRRRREEERPYHGPKRERSR